MPSIKKKPVKRKRRKVTAQDRNKKLFGRISREASKRFRARGNKRSYRVIWREVNKELRK